MCTGVTLSYVAPTELARLKSRFFLKKSEFIYQKLNKKAKIKKWCGTEILGSLLRGPGWASFDFLLLFITIAWLGLAWL
jgi:hypothetical protein